MKEVIVFYVVLFVAVFVLFFPQDSRANVTMRCTDMGAYTLCVNTTTGEQIKMIKPRV